eukprot:4313927-Pyramimonas_sp.AAC.1
MSHTARRTRRAALHLCHTPRAVQGKPRYTYVAHRAPYKASRVALMSHTARCTRRAALHLCHTRRAVQGEPRYAYVTLGAPFKASRVTLMSRTARRMTELGKVAPPNSVLLLDRAVLILRNPKDSNLEPLDRAKIIPIRYLVALLFPIQSYKASRVTLMSHTARRTRRAALHLCHTRRAVPLFRCRQRGRRPRTPPRGGWRSGSWTCRHVLHPIGPS